MKLETNVLALHDQLVQEALDRFNIYSFMDDSEEIEFRVYNELTEKMRKDGVALGEINLDQVITDALTLRFQLQMRSDR